MKSDVIRARVEPDLKVQVEDIFHQLGLTTSEAINMFLRQVSMHRGLPFPVRVPKADLLESIEKSKAGKDVIICNDADDMFNKLGL